MGKSGAPPHPVFGPNPATDHLILNTGVSSPDHVQLHGRIGRLALSRVLMDLPARLATEVMTDVAYSLSAEDGIGG